MAPSGTRRSSFNTRGAEFHDRGGRREISRGREIKYGTLSYSICPASPYPVHPSRHYLPLTSFPGAFTTFFRRQWYAPFLLFVSPRFLGFLSKEREMADRHRGAKFLEKEASESIFRVNQAPPTPDVSSLARW